MYIGGALSATMNSKLYACEPLALVRGDELGMPKGWLEPGVNERHMNRSRGCRATRRGEGEDIIGTASLLALMMMMVVVVVVDTSTRLEDRDCVEEGRRL
jgi:hypothetical protein